jgi:hypothetical protein
MTTNETPNLVSHRASTSVWDKRGWHGPTIEEQIGPWVLSLAGAALVVYGVGRRSWRGAWWIASGIGLITGAAAGLATPHRARMLLRHHLQRDSADPTTTESMDSFPASDAPSSNMTVAAGAKPHPLRDGATLVESRSR